MPLGRSSKNVILFLILAGIAYFIYGKFFGGFGPGGPPGGAPPVSVAEVIVRDVRPWYEFSGRLIAVDQVQVRPRISGTIEEIHFTDGAMVKKGDRLFTIDPRPFEAALQAANARAMLAQSEMQRAQTLMAEKAISQRDYDQRKNAVEVAKAELTRARLDLEYTKVTSPIDGRVGRAEITVGNLVDAGSNAPVLTTVVASSPIYADFEIDEETYLEYVQAGATTEQKTAEIPVEISLGAGGGTYTGGVESFDNQVDMASGTIRVRAVFPNDDGTLVPGLFVRISLGAASQSNAVLITDRAVGTDQNRKFVIVVDKDGKTERREIKPGPLVEGLRVVRSGLKPGEKIVVSGMQRVMMPGQPVMPEIVPMDPKDVAPAAGGQGGPTADAQSPKPAQP